MCGINGCSRVAHSHAHNQLLPTSCVCPDNHVVPPVPVAARLLRVWVRIPQEAYMLVSCECCVLSGRGLWDGLITRPGEFYRLWCVVVCDLETSRMRIPWPALGSSATGEKHVCCTFSDTRVDVPSLYVYIYIYIYRKPAPPQICNP